MALEVFSSQLLNFLYELSKLNRYLDPRNLSATIRINDKKVPTQTIQYWMRFLKNHGFVYFPILSAEKFGLTRTLLLHDAPLTKKTLHAQSRPVYDFVDAKPKILTKTVCWQKENTPGESTFTPFRVCQILNRHVDTYGINNLPAPKENYAYHWERCREYLKHLPEHSVSPVAQQDPLLFCVALECQQGRTSSVQIWHQLKSRFGKEVWQLISKRKSETDSIGIKRVQQAIQKLNNEQFGLIQQIAFKYPPLNQAGFSVFIKLSCSNPKRFLQAVQCWAEHSLMLTIHPKTQQESFLELLTTPNGFKSGLRRVSEFSKVKQRVLLPL